MTAEVLAPWSLLDSWESLDADARTAFLATLDLDELDELERMLAAEWDYRADPVGWVQDTLSEFLWSKQKEILQAVRDHRRVVVRSGHGVGKTRSVSRVVVWWGSVHPPSQTRIVTTATTFAQVRNVLWQEIAEAARSGKIPGRILQTEWHILDLETADDDTKAEVKAINSAAGRDVIVGVGRKPADHAQAAFQGVHARYVLVVIDEADGVPAELFTQAGAIATGPDCRVIAIGNPVDPGSHMATICAPGSGWFQLWISVLHLPTITQEAIDSSDDPDAVMALFAAENLTPSTEEIPDELRYVLTTVGYITEMITDHGVESATFASRVLGRYPVDAADGIVPQSAVNTARLARAYIPGDLWPVELGVDVGAGSDLSVIRARAGIRAMPHRFFVRTKDPNRVVDLVMEAVDEMHPTSIKIDGIGWGWGIAGDVANRLKLRSLRGFEQVAVHIVLVSNKSIDPRRFKNVRSELWWTARDMCREGIWDLSMLPDDDPVFAELIAPRYTTVGDRIMVEPKEDTIKRLKRSPDDADALNLSYYSPPSAVPEIQLQSRWKHTRGRR